MSSLGCTRKAVEMIVLPENAVAGRSSPAGFAGSTKCTPWQKMAVALMGNSPDRKNHPVDKQLPSILADTCATMS